MPLNPDPLVPKRYLQSSLQVCEEYQHWAELVFLYVQYDEFDNAALIMIAHSPTAWEHSHFKDVLVKARLCPAVCKR